MLIEMIRECEGAVESADVCVSQFFNQQLQCNIILEIPGMDILVLESLVNKRDRDRLMPKLFRKSATADSTALRASYLTCSRPAK
jgi:hypothetical protein